jgi:hypothetical protein
LLILSMSVLTSRWQNTASVSTHAGRGGDSGNDGEPGGGMGNGMGGVGGGIGDADDGGGCSEGLGGGCMHCEHPEHSPHVHVVNQEVLPSQHKFAHEGVDAGVCGPFISVFCRGGLVLCGDTDTVQGDGGGSGPVRGSSSGASAGRVDAALPPLRSDRNVPSLPTAHR